MGSLNKLLTKPASKMTKSEREYIRNELNEVDKKDIRKEIEELRRNQDTSNKRLDSIEKDTEKTKSDVENLKKNTDVICSPFHSKRKRIFSSICKARVWKLFSNNKDTCEYVLFSPFLFKKIYSDIATHFGLDTWHDLSMEDFDKMGSTYEQAKEFANYWAPSSWYISECINSMVTKRDNGILSPERCRALTEYLKITNNGKINPFSA